ncbi:MULTISPECIES: ABC transporter substrate binding protein [Bradyrhizobium]|uniref:ABC transporter substrate binding protein n=1 Tax=Bradyrhizobium TaxID=374 RepID=UPI00159B5EFB|nr:hypothetical protein [Bradyrhizobium sp. WBAH30]MDD1541895.1 hypothetical protein [Bradyrhizobium sp. WBAH41]MDD1555239.1 hypothetical protein [Bradyrhizobium sp. WBAH23]MDD1564070.1 hypothetical protein [Bradyrhizobium sp. WBAH33]MDD1587664.1 hypothetical protein [Bradyrhizobium sp. WBAH42]NRB87364.1 hypothetical protein [Bradyrhizobium sp. WBAH10]QCJ88936.1 hypothetical protein DAA57_10820 [Bradyrhizobium yuanmingense]
MAFVLKVSLKARTLRSSTGLPKESTSVSRVDRKPHSKSCSSNCRRHRYQWCFGDDGRATKTIPILFAIAMDPVSVGVVSSLNRPGGNATGVSMYTPQVTAKRLEFLAELTPGGGTIAIMINPTNPNA